MTEEYKSPLSSYEKWPACLTTVLYHPPDHIAFYDSLNISTNLYVDLRAAVYKNSMFDQKHWYVKFLGGLNIPQNGNFLNKDGISFFFTKQSGWSRICCMVQMHSF